MLLSKVEIGVFYYYVKKFVNEMNKYHCLWLRSHFSLNRATGLLAEIV